VDDALLAEQIAYYRARAPHYAQSTIDGLPADALAVAQRELPAALDRFRPAGEVLELACGPGTWTGALLRHASGVTAIDASPEMLALAAQALGDDERVHFAIADIFDWTPPQRFDVVFFGFWLSHVPPERFDEFWGLLADWLVPDGRVLFVDDGYRTADELEWGEQSTTIRRRVADGRAFRIVKVPHEPAALERRLAELGRSVRVTGVAGAFYWGEGGRAAGA
jgi:demethylmenaquinone methyltransferase/2-methoxy-6-polyprenyl-1,4-benzoquinol methylase